MQFNHQAWVRSGAIISFFYSFLLNKSTRAQSCNFLVKENAKGHYRPRGRTKFYRARRAVFHIPLDTAKHPDRKRHGLLMASHYVFPSFLTQQCRVHVCVPVASSSSYLTSLASRPGGPFVPPLQCAVQRARPSKDDSFRIRKK